jgi:hypothetical protein
MGRRIAMYFAWDRIAETVAPLGELDNRFPALFEVRRLFWPGYETPHYLESSLPSRHPRRMVHCRCDLGSLLARGTEAAGPTGDRASLGSFRSLTIMSRTLALPSLTNWCPSFSDSR